jgi:hypothetical protein
VELDAVVIEADAEWAQVFLTKVRLERFRTMLLV